GHHILPRADRSRRRTGADEAGRAIADGFSRLAVPAVTGSHRSDYCRGTCRFPRPRGRYCGPPGRRPNCPGINRQDATTSIRILSNEYFRAAASSTVIYRILVLTTDTLTCEPPLAPGPSRPLRSCSDRLGDRHGHY